MEQVTVTTTTQPKPPMVVRTGNPAQRVQVHNAVESIKTRLDDSITKAQADAHEAISKLENTFKTTDAAVAAANAGPIPLDEPDMVITTTPQGVMPNKRFFSDETRKAAADHIAQVSKTAASIFHILVFLTIILMVVQGAVNVDMYIRIHDSGSTDTTSRNLFLLSAFFLGLGVGFMFKSIMDLLIGGTSEPSDDRNANMNHNMFLVVLMIVLFTVASIGFYLTHEFNAFIELKGNTEILWRMKTAQAVSLGMSGMAIGIAIALLVTMLTSFASGNSHHAHTVMYTGVVVAVIMISAFIITLGAAGIVLYEKAKDTDRKEVSIYLSGLMVAVGSLFAIVGVGGLVMNFSQHSKEAAILNASI